KRQIGEDAIISCRDRVYKLFPREPSTELLRVLVSGYQLDGGEHVVIPDVVPVHLFLLGMDGSFDMK
nr:hypothetical protein [Tanacetum cinerariifolium]